MQTKTQTIRQAVNYLTLAFLVFMTSMTASNAAWAQQAARTQEGLATSEERCTKYTNPVIEFRKIKGGVFFSPALTETALASQKATAYGRKMPDRQGNVGQPEIWHNALIGLQKYPTTGCVYLEDLRLDIRIDHRIYIAGEYPKGSCLHDSFYELEMELLQLDNDLIKEHLDVMEKYLKSVPEEIRAAGPNRRGELSKLEEAHRDNIENIIQSFLLKLEKDLKTQRRDADDPGFYYDILQECGVEPE